MEVIIVRFTDITTADYAVINVDFDSSNTNAYGWRYFELVRTIGTYADFSWGGPLSGYVIRGLHYTMHVGDPARFTGQNLALSLRSWASGVSPSVWDGLAINVSITYFKNTPWSAVTITNSTNGLFNVSIDTTGMPVGFNFGWIYWMDANGNMVHTALTVKVTSPVIDGTSASPNVVGTFTLTDYDDAYWDEHGDLIWVPIAIDETQTTDTSVLVIKAEILNSPNSDLNLIFTYDDIPKYRGGQTIFQQVGLTGPSEIWFYQPWSSIYSYSHTSGGIYTGIWTYKLGLYSEWLEQSDVQVQISAYWLNALPSFTTDFYDSQGNVLSSTDQLLTGPNYMLNATTTCDSPCVDPNLVGQYQLVMGDMKVIEFNDQGTYVNPAAGTSIDKWIGVDLVAGDYVYLEGGDPNDISDNDIYIYAPSTAASKGIPANYPVPATRPSGYDYHTQLDGSAIEYTTFTALETGTYWVGMDDWAVANNDYYLYLNIRRGTVSPQGTTSININTQTDPNFGQNVEATYNPATKSFDKISPVTIGVSTPTNLESLMTDSGLTFGTFIFDNWVAPTVDFTSTTLANNNTVANRVTGSSATLALGWTGSDANGDSLTYHLSIMSPYGTTIYTANLTGTSYNWDYSDLATIPDGEYMISIQADDNVAGGGLSDMKVLLVTVSTSQGVSTSIVTTTETTTETTTITNNNTETVTTTFTSATTVKSNVTSTTTETKSTPGFEVLGVIVLMFSVSAIVIFRRRK